jgi:hypothetical protein
MTKSFFDKLVDGTEPHARIGGRITYTYGPFRVQRDHAAGGSASREEVTPAAN